MTREPRPVERAHPETLTLDEEAELLRYLAFRQSRKARRRRPRRLPPATADVPYVYALRRLEQEAAAFVDHLESLEGDGVVR